MYYVPGTARACCVLGVFIEAPSSSCLRFYSKQYYHTYMYYIRVYAYYKRQKRRCCRGGPVDIASSAHHPRPARIDINLYNVYRVKYTFYYCTHVCETAPEIILYIYVWTRWWYPARQSPSSLSSSSPPPPPSCASFVFSRRFPDDSGLVRGPVPSRPLPPGHLPYPSEFRTRIDRAHPS